MNEQLQTFNEIAELMESRGMESNDATLVAVLMRKPARAKALKDWLTRHPKATNKEVSEQATKIAQTVEPTRHGVRKVVAKKVNDTED